jgi:hypothetical protein
VNLTSGNVTNPSLTFSGNTSTGIYLPTTNAIAFSTAGTEDMRITAAGDVGIGTSNPQSRLHAYTGASGVIPNGESKLTVEHNATAAISILAPAANESIIYFGSPTSAIDGGLIYNHSSRAMIFRTAGNTERMRIDSSGNMLLGRTTQISSEKFGIEVSGSNQLAYLRSTATSGDPTLFRIASGVFSGGIGASGNFIYCEDGGSAKFYVKGNGGIANFSASNTNLSDRREKTNFAPAGEYLSKICNIPVQTFNYIDQNLEDDGDLTLGVVAQDVQEVAPELVTESNWGNEEEPKMRLSIYQTDLQYALMKCIQELKVIVDAQAVEIAALKAK